jgi:hypothetical protein
MLFAATEKHATFPAAASELLTGWPAVTSGAADTNTDRGDMRVANGGLRPEA